VYVRERRNRDPDNRRLWGDLRRSRPSRKEESEWTMIASALSTLNVGEAASLFTRVPRIGFLRSSDLRSSEKLVHTKDLIHYNE
jgi:hypothetical protein